MHLILSRLASLFIALILSACATPMRLDYSGSDVGSVVMSLYHESPTYFESTLLAFRPVGSQDKWGFFRHDRGLLGAFSTGKNYSTEAEHGVTAVAFLPPGEYEFYNYKFDRTLGGGAISTELTYYSKKPFSIPFTVRPGEVAYVGSYRASLSSAGASLSVSNRMSRDLAVARELNAQLNKMRPIDMTPGRSHP